MYSENFAICHVLRELGFSKRSLACYVFSNGDEHIRTTSFLPAEWNKSYCLPNNYTCTIPTITQIRKFAKRLGYPNIKYITKDMLLYSLIMIYREINKKHHPKAFEKYILKYNLKPS
jgi:hypothetical protein